MNFKEAYKEDLNNTFFNEEEFAEIHRIDGEDVLAVVTETSLQNAKMSYGLMKSTINPKETAINKKAVVVFVRECELRKKITTNSMINMDGKKMFVYDVKVEAGVCRILIGAHMV